MENSRWRHRPRSASRSCGPTSCRWEGWSGKISILLCWVHVVVQWKEVAGLLGKEQFPRGGPCVAATDEAWMCGSWDSRRGRQHGSCGRSRGRAANRCLTAPVLKSWSSIEEPHARLRELGALIFGSKDVLFWRLCEWEQNAAKKDEYLENRRKELALATEPVTPKILSRPVQPSEVEWDHHIVCEPFSVCAVVRIVCEGTWEG